MTKQNKPNQDKAKRLEVPQPEGIGEPKPKSTKKPVQGQTSMGKADSKAHEANHEGFDLPGLQCLSRPQMMNKILSSLARRGKFGLLDEDERQEILDKLEQKPGSNLAQFFDQYSGKLTKKEFAAQHQFSATMLALQLLERKAPKPKRPLSLRIAAYLAILSFCTLIGFFLFQSIAPSDLTSSEKSRFVSEASSLRENNEELANLNQELLDKVEKLETQPESKVSSTSSNFEQEVSELKSSNQKLKGELSSEQSKVVSLKKSAANKATESQKQLEALHSKLTAALGRVDSFEAEKVQIQADLKEKLTEKYANETESLSKENLAFSGAISELKERLSDSEEKNAELSSARDSARAEITSLQEQLASRQTKSEQLVSKNAELKKELALLKTESDSVKTDSNSKLTESQKQLEALRSKLATALGRVDSFKAEKVQIQADLKGRLNVLEEKNAELSTARGSAQAEITSLQEQLASRQTKSEQLVSKNAELKKELALLKTESNSVRADSSSKLADLVSKQEKMSNESQASKLALEKEIETLSTKLESNKSESQQEILALRLKYEASLEASEIKDELETRPAHSLLKLVIERNPDIAYELLKLVIEQNPSKDGEVWENFSAQDKERMNKGIQLLNRKKDSSEK